MEFKLEEKIKDLLKNTMRKKGAKHVRKLLDDIINERPLDIDEEIKKELEIYSKDTLRLIVEKNILLSIENSALSTRKSYWEVLKSRAPRIKPGIISHYYDNYISDLKKEKVDTYQARTIDELNDTYNKVIDDSIVSLSDNAMGFVDSVTNINIDENTTDLRVNGVRKGHLTLVKDAKVSGKFVNKDEFVTILDCLQKLPNGAELLTNKNIPISDLKIIINSLNKNINVENNTVTIGQAGIKEVGNSDVQQAELPDGTYISVEELQDAINAYVNKPVEEKKPLKVISFRDHFKREVRKRALMVAMSLTFLIASIPSLKKAVDNQLPVITQQIDESKNNLDSIVSEQFNNLAAGVQDIAVASQEVLDKTIDTVSNNVNQVPEIFNQEPVSNVVATEEINTESPVENVSDFTSYNEEETAPIEEQVNEVVSEVTSDNQIDNDENSSGEILDFSNEIEEPVSDIVATEETNIEDLVEDIPSDDELVEEEKATTSDFSFKYDMSNEIAAAARNKGFTDDQIKKAVAISRQETGNYTSNAFLNKNNFGGMMNKNYEPMTFATREEGLDRFLTMLQDKYFGRGLDSLEQIGRVYDPHNPAWPGKVTATLENGAIKPQEEVASTDESVEETKEESATSVDTPVEEENVVLTEEQEEVNTVVEEPMEEKTIIPSLPTEVEQKMKESEEETLDSVQEPIKEENLLDKVPTAEKEKIVEQDSVENVTVVETPIEPASKPVVEQKPVETPVEPVVQPAVETAPVVEQPVQTSTPTAQAGLDDATTAAMLGISLGQLDTVKATIRHEAGNNPAEILNVASVVANREANSGANAYAVITAPNQFQSYGEGYYKQYTGGNYYQGDAATAAQVNSMMNAILTGQMAPTHGYSSFRGKSSPKGVQLVEGGNKYR